LFLGRRDAVKGVFGDRGKITWVYRDELNDIEERISVGDENLPLIFGIQNVLDKINKFNTTLQDIDLFRSDISQYEPKVIEEMIVNAIVHRDWNINLWVEVVQTPVSLEIRNPGKFRADLDKVLLENKRPEYLNPNLTEFARKMNLMEKEGGGLKKSYATQGRKGLGIRHRFDNESDSPRVDFILSGKVKDVDFARFMFSSKDLSQDQVVILDKINSGRNILHKDVSDDEYGLVRDFVIKRGRGGISLKINEHLLKKSKRYIDNFSSTHTSPSTSRQVILDYARKNGEFSTAEIYGILGGKTKEWVRYSLMEMVRDGHLIRVRRGVYGLVKAIQTKLKNAE
jgi:predicted HTH transcriptional regulator